MQIVEDRELVGGEVDNLGVVDDALLGDRLGEDDDTASDWTEFGEGSARFSRGGETRELLERTLVANENVSSSNSMRLGDLDNLGIFEKRGVGRAERRVGLGNDVLLVEVLDEVVLGEVGVELDC